MIEYLLKSANTVRVADKDEADTLHKQIMEECLENGWILSSWTEKHKEKKVKGDTEEEWMVITYTITFQEEKTCMSVLKGITYDMQEFFGGEDY